MDKYKYRIHIEWSDEDNCYLVALPDFPGNYWRTHGNTYDEALENAKEAIESLIVTYKNLNEKLPVAKTIDSEKASTQIKN